MEMNFNDITAQLGNTTVTPEMLAIMMKVVKLQEKQNKEEQKKKIVKDKQKEKYKPVKRCLREIRRLSLIEQLCDFSNMNDDEIKFWKNWYISGLQPYSSFSTQKELMSMFKENAINFIRILLKRKTIPKLGFITTNSKRGYRRFLIKTEYGVIIGKEAREYMKYLLNCAIRQIGEVVKEVYDKSANLYSSGLTIENEHRSQSMETMLAMVAWNTLRCEENLNDMVEWLIDEHCDEDFVKNYQRACCHPDFKTVVQKLPFSVKLKMYGGCIEKANQYCDSSTDGFSTDDSDSDSDSD